MTHASRMAIFSVAPNAASPSSVAGCAPCGLPRSPGPASIVRGGRAEAGSGALLPGSRPPVQRWKPGLVTSLSVR